MIPAKLARRVIYWTAMVLVGAFVFVSCPGRIGLILQPWQARAVAAHAVKIEGQYLNIDGQSLDLSLKPAVFIDVTSQSLLPHIMVIPAERRPYIIVQAEQQPEFMPPDTDYYWAPNTGTMSPALVWYEQKLIGYMYSAVEPELFKMRYPLLIGQGRVANRPGDGASQNAIRAGEEISGAVVKPGEIFSFYAYVAPSEENGYAEGLTLFTSDESQEWRPAIGGGICKTSTALNFAVENAGLEVIERHHHTDAVSYADLGEDTAVARSGGWDYQFRNTTDKSIQIISQQNEDALEFRIYAILDES